MIAGQGSHGASARLGVLESRPATLVEGGGGLAIRGRFANAWSMFIRNGAIELFRLFGITVYLHWSWLLVAAYQIQVRTREYSSPMWPALEYSTIFLIVLMHEFGHALACRSVGGRAERIMLWPLGGIAFVKPPMRPGALLWSIFAGPLVNIVLIPITLGLRLWAHQAMPSGNLAEYASALVYINGWLLVFNLMPVYPLDGGQIFQAILWFALGFVRSLRVVSVLGFLGAVGLGVLFFKGGADPIAYLMVAFLAWQAVNGFRLAQYIAANPDMLGQQK